jgi:PIN domain nuclease of toxin-antitoxin system
VNILLDTHIFIWWNDSPDKITKKARHVIEDQSNTIYISAVVIWEMTVKAMLGKLDSPDDPLAIAVQEGFVPLPITAEHALKLKTLESYHSDPFDRLLIAQAKHEGFTLLTHDKTVMSYADFEYIKA